MQHNRRNSLKIGAGIAALGALAILVSFAAHDFGLRFAVVVGGIEFIVAGIFCAVFVRTVDSEDADDPVHPNR